MRKFLTIGFIGLVLATVAYVVSDGDPWDRSEYQLLPSGPFDRIVLVADDQVSSVWFHLIFPSAEKHNPYTQGLAHYVEHLAFFNMPDWADPAVSSHSNAWTNLETTGYWVTSTADKAPASLRQLIKVADPVQATPEFAETERGILLREYEFRAAENPVAGVLQDVRRAVYDDGPLGRSVLGTPDEIMSYTLQQARDLHAMSHNLSRATLYVYGNISEKRLENAVAGLGLSGAVSDDRGGDTLDIMTLDPVFDHQVIQVPRLAEPMLVYQRLSAVPSCMDTAICGALLHLAAAGLDSAMAGGLAGPLRFEHFVARSFDFDLTWVSPNAVLISFVAHPDAGVSLDDLEQAYATALDASLRTGLPDGTIDRTRDRARSDIASILPQDRTAALSSHVMDQLSLNLPLYDLAAWDRALGTISNDQVNALLRDLQHPHRTVVRHVMDKE